MSGVFSIRRLKTVALAGVVALHCLFPLWVPPLVSHLKISSHAVDMIGAVHECLSSLLSAFVIWEVFKKKSSDGTNREGQSLIWLKMLGIASLLVAIGDLNYGFTAYILRIPPPRGFVPLVHEIPYSLFSVYLAYSVTLRALQGLKTKEKVWVGALIAGLGGLYAFASYRLILNPFFHATPVRPLAIYGTATIYAIAQSIFLGSLLVASFRTVDFLEFGLWALFLTLTGSDFVLRYQDIGGVIPAIPGFEYGWEFALAGISSVLFFCHQRAKSGEKPFWEEEPAPLLSFRVLTAVITLLALVAFFAGTWELSSFLGMAAAGALASAIVYFVFIWAASNGISILLSRGFREVYLRLNFAGDMSTQEASSSRLLWEVRDLFEFLADRNAALREEKNHVLRITSSVAHNVKPPLASIKAATLILESYGPARSDEAAVKQWRESMELLRGAYRSMKATADQMLTERKRIRKEEEIEVAAQTALQIAKDNYPDKVFTLNVAEEARGHVATSELGPHLLSLLSNAADATKTSAVPIELNVAQEEASIKIEIVDRGAGIAPGLLTALRRGEERTTKAHGNGIGVSSIIRWVRENRYEFQLDSQVGEGTKAILRIPLDTGVVS